MRSKTVTTRKIISIDEEKCNGCGLCAGACAEGAIEIRNGKARLVKDSFCDGLGACLGECPQGALTIIEREADAFDEEAVAGHQKSGAGEREKEGGGDIRHSTFDIPVTGLGGGCPSARIQSFAGPCDEANQPRSQASTDSSLTHWPVQIRLVPPTAPFLQGAHLLVAADCTAFAHPGFHGELLDGKVLMVGCPKFDDVDLYAQKFADIFRSADIRSVTVAIMEVPCCSKLPPVVRKGMELAGKESLPFEVAIVGIRGGVLRRQRLAAAA